MKRVPGEMRKWMRYLGLALLLATGMVAHGAEMTRGTLTVEYPEGRDAWARMVMGHAHSALRILNGETRHALLVKIHIRLMDSEEDFHAVAGPGLENSLAVSISGRREIVVNGPKVEQAAANQWSGILTHELAHVYVDTRLGSAVPHWLHEGIAQVAGKEGLGVGASRLMLAAALGRLIPLSDLEGSFPSDEERNRLAYAESLSVVQYLVGSRFDGSFPAFLAWLEADHGRGLNRLKEPVELAKVQAEWRANLLSTGNWIGFVFDSSMIWIFVIFLTGAAWIVMRRRRKKIRKEWEEEGAYYGEDGGDAYDEYEYEEEAGWHPPDEEGGYGGWRGDGD